MRMGKNSEKHQLPRIDISHLSRCIFLRRLGNRIQASGLQDYPSATELAVTYHRNTITIIQLRTHAELDMLYNIWSTADVRGLANESDGEGEEEEEAVGLWECPK